MGGWNVPRATAAENRELGKMLATIKPYMWFKVVSVNMRSIVGLMKYDGQDDVATATISRKTGREYGISENGKGWQKLDKSADIKYEWL